VPGLVMTFLPPIVASAIIIRYMDLEPHKRSRFGQYVRRHMTPGMMAVRLAGALIMSVAAWLRLPIGLPVGLLVVLVGWSRGLLFGQVPSVSDGARTTGLPRTAHTGTVPGASRCSPKPHSDVGRGRRAGSVNRPWARNTTDGGDAAVHAFDPNRGARRAHSPHPGPAPPAEGRGRAYDPGIQVRSKQTVTLR